MFETLEEIPIFKDILHQKWAEGEEIGLAKGEEIGLAKGRAEMLLIIVQGRFPELEALARQLVQYVTSPALLKEAAVGVSTARTEEQARQRLCSYLPS